MAMQRPIMNPTFLDDEPIVQKPSLLQRLLPIVGQLARLVGKVLFYDPLQVGRIRKLRIDDGSTAWQRFCRGLLYRLTFVPLLAALFVVAFVYCGTHPKTNRLELDPNSQG